MRTTTLLLGSVAMIAMLTPAAHAQSGAAAQTEQQDSDAAIAAGQDIIVTGTRAEGRTRLDAISPVDVLSADALQRQGTTETAAALATVAPSIDFPRPSATDGTDAIRPATLRGLSPDQTLVLINGIRGHPSALLNVNGSVGRGSASVDLNTIPTAALQSIEVLRDGASALYGSDAIAGVVNLRLRQERTGGGASVTFGGYDTHVPATLAPRDVTDGGTVTASLWQNIPIGDEGYLDLTTEWTNREPTSRGDLDTRDSPAKVRSRFGDPDVRQHTTYANLGVPLGDSGWQVVGWGGYQHRRTQSAAFPRNPSNSNNVPSVYPDGFLPLIQTVSEDYTITGGVKGQISGWDTSLIASYGRNKIDYSTIHSINASYGADSPTEFYDGANVYDQFVTNLDISHDYALGGGDLTVAAGAEYRRESYQIEAGEPLSYAKGPLAASAGAQGFAGFSPENVVDQHRDNVSGYLDLEGRFGPISIGAAGRVEHYSDFGTTANGKLSGRWDISPSFALRGGIQTGFRAPSLQQQYFTSIQSVIIDRQVVLTGTFPSVSEPARLLGGQPLEPEKSTNYSLGFVYRSGAFNLTVDAYQIDLRNGLALSENIVVSALDTPQYRDIYNSLISQGVQRARFFLNGVKQRARGVDVVANYRLDTDNAGRFNFTLAGNYNDIDVRSVPETTSVLDPAPTLVSRQRIVSIEDGTPQTKITGSIDWSLGDFGLTARAAYYGDVNQPGSTSATDLHTGKHIITDAEARFTVADQFHFGFGVDNIFDVYPDAAPATVPQSGVVAFPFYSPFGFNGRRLYVKAGLDW
ncbi:TonB-dependent receptor plug domain-containing protein [Stakelama pacifica]|uniref:Iron complex outermembrane receptor protein n=1 Tax=Stakelama pacifica TaxID=517720 RepID=A0A4R6FQB4_9SPHN|nr:TonB-dependent receptor [Stakelama pacifica]TDN82905.1 iron complex outermembrane receptor protein [Stakelama pacifica]GGO95242.1 TonB-dependent receptor [Stakelama pacifica]